MSVRTDPLTTPTPTKRTTGAWTFLAHLGLALVLMAAGMAVLMALSTTVLLGWLATVGPPLPLVNLTLMGLSMALPVLAWLILAGHPRGVVLPMSGVLLGPSVLVLAALAVGALGYADASLWQHVLMLGGLAVVMGVQYRHFASAPPAAQSQDRDSSRRSWTHWWPTALGLAFAVFSLVTDDPADVTGALVTLVIPTAAYATIAASGRSRWSWPILGLLVVGYLAASALGDAGVPLLAAVTAAALLAGALLLRWGGPPREMRWQAAAAIVFLASAWAAQLAAPDLARVALALLLLVHGAWDVHHWRRDVIVSRSLSQWCAALDITLGLGILLLVVTG